MRLRAICKLNCVSVAPSCCEPSAAPPSTVMSAPAAAVPVTARVPIAVISGSASTAGGESVFGTFTAEMTRGSENNAAVPLPRPSRARISRAPSASVDVSTTAIETVVVPTLTDAPTTDPAESDTATSMRSPGCAVAGTPIAKDTAALVVTVTWFSALFGPAGKRNDDGGSSGANASTRVANPLPSRVTAPPRLPSTVTCVSAGPSVVGEKRTVTAADVPDGIDNGSGVTTTKAGWVAVAVCTVATPVPEFRKRTVTSAVSPSGTSAKSIVDCSGSTAGVPGSTSPSPETAMRVTGPVCSIVSEPATGVARVGEKRTR